MVLMGVSLCGQEIERFEHLDTRHGLSQNAVLSIYCDQHGLMWFGTMDGLNRYNGYTFKIYKAIPGEKDVLTNNRIVEIWEDPHHFIWVKTHDGYFHYLDERIDRFTTFPFYQESEEEKNSEIEFYCQSGEDEIWLGATQSGVYHLKYDPQAGNYNIRHFLNRGIFHITNNSVRLLHRDRDGNIWTGTRQGLNMLTAEDVRQGDYNFQHMFVDVQFSSVAELGNRLYFGTLNRGIIVYDLDAKEFSFLDKQMNPALLSSITVLLSSSNEKMIIGTEESGLVVFDPEKNEFQNFMQKEPGKILALFEDHTGDLWINTDRFGITRLDGVYRNTTFYTLTPSEIVPLVDNERQYIYEDSKGQLWIGLHGAGLALYNRENEQFEFFRNDPDDPKTISSSFVHCLTEDRAGQLWVGTGQFNGGINKVIYKNPAFRQVIQKQKIEDHSDNVVRSLLQDSNGCIWAGTKSGLVYVYDTLFNRKALLTVSPVGRERMKGYNVYTMLQDAEGYIWLGTKGGGVSVSERPLSEYANYQYIRFYHYTHDPSDPASLGSNFIYSIYQDRQGSIWIGNYGGGLQKVEDRTEAKLVCISYNQSNSNLSSNEVRQVYEDGTGRLWVATTFGLDLMKRGMSKDDSIVFRTFNYNPLDPGSISYNDVIHIFQDSRENLWLGTFGGGVNNVRHMDQRQVLFNHYNMQSGLINDAVFGIVEDNDGYLWFSTENGISRMDPESGSFDNYDNYNGLLSSGFSENTCIKLSDGRLLFGTIHGILVITPSKLEKSEYTPPVILTNFQLNNKDLDIHDENSPIRMNIEFLDEIELRYGQNSFSIEYTALNYQDPNKNKYSFILENFEESWNEVGVQRKATYTNISPGKYTFMVKAVNWDGSWNSVPRSLTIKIHPPWHRTLLAYIIYALLILTLAEIARRILSKYNRMRSDLRVERRVNEIKLQFFTNISHEIRTPLTLILGPLDDLIHEPLPQRILKPVEVIQRNGKKMLHLVNQLLDFRKIQNNKMNLRVEETEIVAFTHEIYENFEYLARQRNIDFKYTCNKDQYNLWIDREKLDIVLFNLLSNAFKFTPKGKRISLTVHIPEGDPHVEIVVEDDGKGIPAQKLPQLFERFSTLSFDAQGFTGTGIGLALSRELVRLHHGEIDVSSAEQKGSRFTVKIPAGNGHFEATQIVQSSGAGSHYHMNEALSDIEEADVPASVTSAGKGQKLLIIEDNPEIMEYIAESFREGYEITCASDGQEGLEQVRKDHVDLIITDIMMPVMDGITFTRLVKEDFELSHIPIVMLTARSGINDQIDGLESGAEAYVLKPFNARYLHAVVAGLIRQRQLIFNSMAGKDQIRPGKIKITNKDEQFLDKVVNIIDENYDNPEFNVEKLAEQSAVGRTVFYNKVKGLTGLTPVEFLRQMRLKIAAQLLESSDYNISEIAYMTGFNDEKYFSRCFRSVYGKTPTEYRKERDAQSVNSRQK